jgi:hypothetical protein
VSFQFPVPSTQNSFAPHEALTVTTKLSLPPRVVKTTCPEPLTVPFVNWEPFFRTLHWFAAVFPPIVSVIVSVVFVSVWLHAKLLLTVHAVYAATVMSAVASLSLTTKFWTFTEPSAIVPVAFTVSALNVMLNPVLVRVAAALTDRLVAATFEPSVVLPKNVSVGNVWPDATVSVLPEPVNVTVEEVEVQEVADDVFQFPPIEIVAEAKVIVAAPDEVTFPLNVSVDEVRVRVADQVRLPVKVVETPPLTVRLNTVCGTFTEPEDVPTTIVEVPGENVAPAAEVSIDFRVIVELFAVSVPVAVTVSPEVPVRL